MTVCWGDGKAEFFRFSPEEVQEAVFRAAEQREPLASRSWPAREGIDLDTLKDELEQAHLHR